MSPLAVVALVGRMVVLFALLMLVPLAFALVDGDAGRDAFATGTVVTLLAGVAMSIATLRFRRELQPRDGFLLVGADLGHAAGLRRTAAGAGGARA